MNELMEDNLAQAGIYVEEESQIVFSDATWMIATESAKRVVLNYSDQVNEKICVAAPEKFLKSFVQYLANTNRLFDESHQGIITSRSFSGKLYDIEYGSKSGHEYSEEYFKNVDTFIIPVSSKNVDICLEFCEQIDNKQIILLGLDRDVKGILSIVLDSASFMDRDYPNSLLQVQLNKAVATI